MTCTMGELDRAFNKKSEILFTLSLTSRAHRANSGAMAVPITVHDFVLVSSLMADAGSLTNNLKMCQVSDHLLKKKTAIEKHLYQKERDLFSLQETITLYDLTNTYFEGQCLSHSLAKRGHSKEKRRGCLLVTLALVLDDSGLSKRSHIYKGNVNEPSTLGLENHPGKVEKTTLATK